MTARLQALEDKMDLRFNAVDERFKAMDDKMDLRFNAVDIKFQALRVEIAQVKELLDLIAD